jgi:uncharacterized protein involved in type VI secretion and phage assembly
MPPTYVAEPLLQIDNRTAPAALIEDILQISVEESLHLPATFVIILKNDYFFGLDQQAWQHQNLFSIGTSIRIGFASSTTEAKPFSQASQNYVIEGEVTAMETHFTSDSQAPIIIRGYDISHRLHRGRYNRSFQNMTDTDIVRKIIGEVGISAGKIDSTGGPYGYGDINNSNGYTYQNNQTNMDFLRHLAIRNGFELFVQDGRLNFCKPEQSETLKLKWLEDLNSFRVRVSSAEQVSSVEVRSWDYSQKRSIVETANRPKTFTKNDYGEGSQSATFKGKPSSPTAIIVDRPVSAQEARTIAQSLCDELGGEFVRADGCAEGNPNIRPGKMVQLQNMGKYSGEYYITETRHLFDGRIYNTDFSVRGLRGGDLLSTLQSQPRLQPGQTPLVGIVTDNEDPNGWGRVRVKLPTLTEEHTSYWARVVAIGAGSQRGFDCLPEVNDEVLVAFEHGDIHRPYVLGGVWNGKDRPPEWPNDSTHNGLVRLRTFQTRIGHTLQFVDGDKGARRQGIYTDTAAGHHLHFNDTDRFAELKTPDGNTLLMSDKNKKINLTSTGDINVKSGKTGSSNNINLNAGTIAITGQQKITLKVGSSSIEIAQNGITLRSAANINIQGIQVNVKGTTGVNIEGITANIKGGTANIQAGTVGISGGLVRINS